MRALRGALIVPAAAIVVGCGTIRQLVKDMQHIQTCATQSSRAQTINISMGGAKRFTIGLINSPIDTLPAAERAAAVRKVAECVRDNYSRYGTLGEVAVVFTHRTEVGGAKVSASGTPIVFTTRDLGPRPGATRADSAAGQAKAPPTR